MSATNSTPNYKLSQYTGSDKPTYLGDYNTDMLKIDTNMKRISNKAEGAESGIASATATANQALENANTANTKATTAQATAEQAQTSATNAQSTATEAKETATQAQTTATEAKETATQAQTTATEAKETATQAQTTANKAESNIEKLNLTNFQTFTRNEMAVYNNSINLSENTSITVACNADGSIGKIYGKITGQTSSSELVNVTIKTFLRPTTQITINPHGILQKTDDRTFWGTCPVVIDVDGTVTFRAGGVGGQPMALIYFDSLLFMKDFGDVQ